MPTLAQPGKKNRRLVYLNKLIVPNYQLRTFMRIVTAHPYCAQYSHATSCSECMRWVVKWTIIGQTAIAITMRGFNELRHSVTHFSFEGSFSLPIFSVLWKNKENLLSRRFNCLQNTPSNSVHLTSSFSCAAVSNASLRVKVCENDGNI